MFKVLALTALLAFASAQDDCGMSKQAQVTVASKDGESCLMEHKCKMILRRREGNEGAKGNVFYQCWVPDVFYHSTSINETVVVDLTKDTCERVNP